MHDATRCLMGSPGASDAVISQHSDDPAGLVAGVQVRQKNDGTLSLLVADGFPIGISMGRSLSDTKKTAVCRSGTKIPVRLSQAPARGSVTITSYANLVAVTPDTVTIGATAFTAQSGAATLGQATFRAATSNNATAISLAAQINAHATAGALVEAVVDTVDNTKVNIVAKLNTTAGNAIALAYADLGTATIGATVSGAFLTGGDDAADYVTLGAKVYFSDVTGMADAADSDSTISDAVYVSGVLSGYDEDGNAVAAALVDMQGGL